jgi:transcriptional regulator with XRE-family HTH domain
MFGQRLRALRRAQGLALTELAERAGVSASYLSRVERGMRGMPGVPILRRLASALGVSLDRLIALEDDRTAAGAAHEPPALYGVPDPIRRQLEEGIALLTPDDWADLEALLGSKILRRHRR